MRLCSRSKRATKDLAAPAVAGVWGIPYCRELIESLFCHICGMYSTTPTS